MARPLRVLNIVGNIAPGGMENFIMNVYEQLDREKVQFDIALHLRMKEDYVERIMEMGGIVHQLPRFSRHPVANLLRLYRIVKENRYQVVVRHTANALVTPQLLAARLAGAYTVCHSHNETDPQKTLHKIGKLLMGIAAKERFACSPKAGNWMYGRKEYKVIHNAINIAKFEYSVPADRRIRQEFGIGDHQHVYGFTANFKESKNHVFLLAVFKEILELDSEARLFFVGDGELREEIETEIQRLGLEGKVVLTGMRRDSEDFMSCFDVMVFPSKFEGLPLTMIEAQASGLPCLMSDAVTPEVIITKGLVETETIKAAPGVWAERAFKMAGKIPFGEKGTKRACQHEAIAKAGYDAAALAKWYEAYFAGLDTGRLKQHD